LHLQELKLVNFRNYSEPTCLKFGRGVNLILGENAQGKSNLLEAVYYLSAGHSFRPVKDADMVNFYSDYFRLEGTVKCDSSKFLLAAFFDGRKQFFVDGIKKPTVAEAVGKLAVVLFAPEHLLLIKGSPSLRRKYLDYLLLQVHQKYYFYLKQLF